MRYRDGYDKPLAWMESGKVYKVDAAAADDEQLLRRRPPAAHRGVEQQLPALRSQPQHRRQQLRREQGRRRAQRGAPLRKQYPSLGDGDRRQEILTSHCGSVGQMGQAASGGQIGRVGLERSEKGDQRALVVGPAEPSPNGWPGMARVFTSGGSSPSSRSQRRSALDRTTPRATRSSRSVSSGRAVPDSPLSDGTL